MPLLALIESTVQCPWVGPTDVDTCLSCPRFRSLHQEDGRNFVFCAHRTDRMESFLMSQATPARLGKILRYRRT